MTIFPWLILAGLVVLYFSHSGTYKGRALQLAQSYCREQDLQLLDQSMVIRGLWPVRRADGRLTLRRTYHFEFASTGDQRYRGILVLKGMQLVSVELEAYKLPLDE